MPSLFDLKLNPNLLGLGASLFGAGQGGAYPLGGAPNQWERAAGSLFDYANNAQRAKLFDLQKQQMEAEARKQRAEEERRKQGQRAAMQALFPEGVPASEPNVSGFGISDFGGYGTPQQALMAESRDARNPLPNNINEQQRQILAGMAGMDPMKAMGVMAENAFKDPEKEDTSVRTQKIAELRARGISENDAQDIADGRVKVSGPDLQGNFMLVNVATAQTRPLSQRLAGQVGSEKPAAPAQTTQSGVPSYEDTAQSGTGPYRSIESALDATVGSIFDVQMFPETAKNKDHIRKINQEIKTALVNNPKFPVAEQSLVSGLLVNPDGFWTNRAAEMQKAKQLRNHLEQRKVANNRALQSATMTKERRGELLDQNVLYDRILYLIGNPPQENSGADPVFDRADRILEGR